jgi:hypothetical protein
MPWNPVTIGSEVLAVHAAFLNFDRILFLGGDQHDPKLAKLHQVEATRLYQCNSGTITKVASPPWDAFCSGHALTAHGTLMLGGGTYAFKGVVGGLHHEHFPGVRDTAICRYEQSGFGWHGAASFSPGENAPLCRTGQNPEVDQCTVRANYGKSGGRWYPTLVTLGDGDVLAIGGHPGAGDREHDNYIPEVFTPDPPPRGAWHRLGSFTDPVQDPSFKLHAITNYPRVHLLPTGDVLYASPTMQQKTVTMTVKKAPWSGTFASVCKFSPLAHENEYGGYGETSVLLPLVHPHFHASVMVLGGTHPWILDLRDWQPGVTQENAIQWHQTPPRKLPGAPRRMHGHAVLLPTGEVLSVGGVAGVRQASGEVLPLDASAVLWPEIYDPFQSDPAKRWRALTNPSEHEKVPRNYHSVALLMRDGRVWTAGSDHNAGTGTGPGEAAELRIEIYEPWYHGNSDRPEILAAPDHWLTGQEFVIRSTQANRIRRVAQVRCGSCTHGFNPDQRYLSLKFKHDGGDILTVTAAPNGNVAPPGFYFLYTVNDHGLPSEGITIYHSTDPETHTERAWDALYHGEG